MYNASISDAISRSLLLGPEYLARPVGSRFGVEPNCTEEEVLSRDVSLYTRCHITRGTSSEWCGVFLIYNPKCRSLSVNRALWENDIIRERIIHAALYPCSFLINVKERNEEEFLQEILLSSKLYGYEAWSPRDHEMLWKDAGCVNGAVNVVFFEIYEERHLIKRPKEKLIKVYKTYRKNENIGGNYVRL